MFVPTTTVTVERAAVGQDALGDDTEAWTPVAAGVRAHISQEKATVSDIRLEESGEPAQVRYNKLMVQPGTPLEVGYRVTDSNSHPVQRFTITHVYELSHTSPVGHEPGRARMRRVAS